MPASKSARAPGAQVFMIPELLNVILAHLNRSKQARLMRMSRPLFHCAGALVWRDLSGITKLFSLLPGAIIRAGRRNGSRMSTMRVITIKLPESSDFTRFELYAQFVRTLDLLDVYELQNSRALRAYRDENKGALLPYLVSLTCEYGDQQSPRAVLDWIDLFLSPSLLKFTATAGNEYSFLVDSKKLRLRLISLLRHLPQKCPTLEEIRIPAIRNSPIPQVIGSFDLYESLSLLPHLRVVSGSELLLESQNMALLSALPCLESLVIHSRGRQSLALGLDWPIDCFPVLHQLRLFDLGPETTRSLLKTKALVGNLTDIDINMSCHDPNRIDQWPYLILCEICTQSIHITTLSLSFSGLFYHISKLSSAELELLRQLPLQNVYLQQIQLGDEVTHLDFVLAVPEVRVLRLPMQVVELQDLHFYAVHLPRLEVLSMRLTFNPKSHVRAHSHVPVAHKVVLEIIYSSEMDGYVTAIAGELYNLWPGVHCAVPEKVKGSSEETFPQRLNNAILKCRGKRPRGSIRTV